MRRSSSRARHLAPSWNWMRVAFHSMSPEKAATPRKASRTRVTIDFLTLPFIDRGKYRIGSEHLSSCA